MTGAEAGAPARTAGSGPRHTRGGASRRRPGFAPALGSLLAGLLALAALVGCSSGPAEVRVTGAPEPQGADRAACEALIADLPATLGQRLDRRKVAPPVTTAAAYGDHPAVLTCGAEGVAPGYRPEAKLAEVNNVGWFVEDLGDEVRYSTPTRRPQVVLTLPAGVEGFPVLTALAPAVQKHTVPTTA